MQNHAVSFAKADWQVDLIGFRGQCLFLVAHGRCRIVYRCHGLERQDPPALLTLDSQISCTWWEGIIRTVWSFESSFPSVFSCPNFVLRVQAILYSCPGTLNLFLSNGRIPHRFPPSSLQNSSALFAAHDWLLIGIISVLLS
jgi:hypothetical protein